MARHDHRSAPPVPARPGLHARRRRALALGLALAAGLGAAAVVALEVDGPLRQLLGLDYRAAGHVVRRFPDASGSDAEARAALYAALAEMPSGLDPDDPRKVREGAAIYADACAACHGADLSGAEDWRTRLPSGRLPAPPHDATGHSWHHPDQHLFALTALGPGPFAPPGYESDMPAFRDRLSDDQIWAVLSFIKSRWPADIRAAHDRISAGMAR